MWKLVFQLTINGEAFEKLLSLLRNAGICDSIHKLIYINGFTSRGCASRLPTKQVVRSTRKEISNGLGAFCAGPILI